MKVFECESCGNLVFFENVACVRCQHTLGFVPELINLSALEPDGNGMFQPLATLEMGEGKRSYRLCENSARHEICNWLVPSDDPEPLCRACRLNLVIPDLSVQGNRAAWHKLELAKRRVIYSLLRLGLPMDKDGDRPSLQFRFMADPAGGPPVVTGHENGIITINVAEADDAERERRRAQLHEPYRTLLGHVRHEVAHYYWDRLVAGTSHLARFRVLFGDEQKNYAEALQAHYRNGPPPGWPDQFVSAYATSHPWEDWAESWAHYLHTIDSLETAGSFGLSLRPRHAQAASMCADPGKIEVDTSGFDKILAHWMPLTYALNELNRGMGLPDLYPFVLADATLEKLRFIHSLLQIDRRRATRPM